MSEFEITYKVGSGRTMHRHPPDRFAVRALGRDIQSIRLPVSYKEQKHLPGYFWMSCMNSLVAYESRLEMTILMQLDYNRAVRHVVSQPFVLHYTAQNKVYRHTPDFLVLYENGAAEVINVKPRKFLDAERNRRSFIACKDAAKEMGWAYSTRCEVDPVLLANLKWLAGYRRQPVGLREFAPRLVQAGLKQVSIAQAVAEAGGLPALVRPVVFHLLWTGVIEASLHERLTDQTVLYHSGRGKNL